MLDNYKTFIDQESFNSVGLISTIVGFFLLSYFFIYQNAYKIKERSLHIQLIVAFLSSGALAVGIFFLLLSVGIYM